MKKITRIVALVLVLVMGLSLCALALEERQSEYISSTWAIATSMGDGKIDIDFSVVGTNTMSSIGATSIKVYKGDGTLVETYRYTDKGYEHLMATNTFQHSSYVTFTGTPGINYYAVVTMFAGNENGYDARSFKTQMARA